MVSHPCCISLRARRVTFQFLRQRFLRQQIQSTVVKPSSLPLSCGFPWQAPRPFLCRFTRTQKLKKKKRFETIRKMGGKPLGCGPLNNQPLTYTLYHVIFVGAHILLKSSSSPPKQLGFQSSPNRHPAAILDTPVTVSIWRWLQKFLDPPLNK